ncbi:MAG: hypothetical protein GX597_05870, partial [Anaerolineaceae bacterium]|nr:hypothetical protein [Anaerolineaceae bacterium]
LRAGVEAELQEGVEYARSSPLNPPEAALEDIYVHFDHAGNPLDGGPQGL